MDQETINRLALFLIPGLGLKKIRFLIEDLGGARSILMASRGALKRAGLGFAAVAEIVSKRAMKEAELEAERAAKAGSESCRPRVDAFLRCSGKSMTFQVRLYCLGGASVVIVGSRRCSIYGMEVSRKFARELCKSGLTIVSGLARGIDSQDHLVALEAGGRTVGGLGSGIDIIYPRENARVF